MITEQKPETGTKAIREIAGRIQSLSYSDMMAVAARLDQHFYPKPDDPGYAAGKGKGGPVDVATSLIGWADAVLKEPFEDRPTKPTYRVRGGSDK